MGTTALNHGNLIMVTSALVGEGKSFTSVNLAMSIAMELDNTVMLVDADVARPSVLRMLGLPPGPGLLDLLEGKTDMPSVLLKTNIDKLTILPSGTPHPQATELLASDAMRVLLDDMASRYPDRIIVFDSPPLLLDHRSAGPGDADGPGRDGRPGRQDPAGRCPACALDDQVVWSHQSGAQQGAGRFHRRLQPRLRVWLRLRYGYGTPSGKQAG